MKQESHRDMNPGVRDHRANSEADLKPTERKQLITHRVGGTVGMAGVLDSECLEEGLTVILRR